MDELNLHHTFEDVRNVFIHYIKNEDDRNNIKKAYDFVVEKHKTQFRKSGEPYVQRLIETAYTVANLTLCSGFHPELSVKDFSPIAKNIFW